MPKKLHATIALFYVLILESCIKSATLNSGICSSERNEFKCCTDYIKKGDTCLPCIGYSGPQCTKKCTSGFYGFGCRSKCECKRCDNVNGSCLRETIMQETTWFSQTDNISSSLSMSPENIDEINQLRIAWIVIGIASSSSLTLGCALIIVLCVKNSKRNQSRSPHDQVEECHTSNMYSTLSKEPTDYIEMQ